MGGRVRACPPNDMSGIKLRRSRGARSRVARALVSPGSESEASINVQLFGRVRVTWNNL
jgi:hypothetical protein